MMQYQDLLVSRHWNLAFPVVSAEPRKLDVLLFNFIKKTHEGMAFSASEQRFSDKAFPD